MAEHPYKSLPDKAFWRRAISGLAPGAVDPTGVFDLKIARSTKVATGGSCFAQHIARYLKTSGFNYYVAEEGHPIVPPEVRERHSYGLFSARYGNIYTARQLVQLMERAYGRFTPDEPAWVDADGSVRDPLRPTAQPGNFVSVQEMEADRAQHLAAVREMFETLDVFVFTLGLTECWRSRSDGAVFPLCPGVEGGVFDPARYEFYNQTAEDVVNDMTAFLEALRQVNPEAQVVLTVSPVPLMATAEPGAHVLSATTYSKSVLRVAAEMLRQRFGHVHYFPSYEVVTGNFSRGHYYAPDLRNVVEDGVSHAMKLFFAHAVEGGEDEGVQAKARGPQQDDHLARIAEIIEVECDEALLDREERGKAS